jgi:hypothetical protein
MDAAEIDRELDELEKKGEHLRAMYEQYFMGIERLEPLVHKRDVERRIKLLRKEQIRNTAQRFKFNTLVARFSTMQQHWGRIVREIENGTYKRDMLRAAARFGDVALGTGKKSKELLAAAAEAAKRSVEESYELASDDLIDEEEDEAPTPPKLGEPPKAMETAPHAPSSGSPLAAPQPAKQPLAPQVGGGLRALSGRAMSAAPQAQAAPQAPDAGAAAPQAPGTPAPRGAGLRWGGGAPAEPAKPAGDVKKRVAELAAQLTARRSNVPSRGAELELDADPAPPSAPAAPASQGLRPAALAPRTPAPASPASRAVAPAAPSPPAASGFGVIDVGVEDGAPPAPAAPQRPAVARPTTTVAPAASRMPARPAPPPAEPARADGDLAEQRIRQIYAKYVETKRSTQESTAGVTYEKLAATLRAQADKLRTAHPNRSVDYEVVIKDGKTHLKPVLR